MADLVALDPEPAGESVIETLEHVLARARAGEISSVAIAIVHRDGRANSTWSTLPSRAAMLGSISRLSHRINMEADR